LEPALSGQAPFFIISMFEYTTSDHTECIIYELIFRNLHNLIYK
jgi:hypothetical protein